MLKQRFVHGQRAPLFAGAGAEETMDQNKSLLITANFAPSLPPPRTSATNNIIIHIIMVNGKSVLKSGDTCASAAAAGRNSPSFAIDANRTRRKVFLFQSIHPSLAPSKARRARDTQMLHFSHYHLLVHHRPASLHQLQCIIF